MSTFVSKIILFTCFSIASFSVTAKENTESTAPQETEIREVKGFFDETLNDMQEELQNAKDENKKGVLLMFEMDECPFCARMKKTVLNRGMIQDYFKENFRILSVDIEGDLELTDFEGKDTTQKDFSLKQFRVRATPVFQFVDLKRETHQKWPPHRRYQRCRRIYATRQIHRRRSKRKNAIYQIQTRAEQSQLNGVECSSS